MSDDSYNPQFDLLAKDSTWHSIPTPSFQKHDSTENSLITQTLRTEGGVRAIQTYVRRSQDQVEVCMVFSLGNGVNGIKDTCHGGMISLMLDEVTGQLAAEVFGRYNIVTAGLNVSFKRRIQTPATVVCKAWHKRDSGEEEEAKRWRKLVVKASIEGEAGLVFATGEGIFVRIDHKL